MSEHPRPASLATIPLPTARTGEVHVWYAPPDGSVGPSDPFELLDETERARASRFRDEQDRIRFVRHRAFARRVLAGYLGVAPTAVTIASAPSGKPELQPPCRITFNTSRSAGLSVIAVSRGCVGVDVERVRPITDALEIAAGFFADGELRWLRTQPSGSRSSAFLALWTRKESVVKAFGTGLSQPFDAFDVSDDVRTHAGRWDGKLGTTAFVMQQLDTPPGWVGAVTATGTRLHVRRMDAADLAP